MGARTLPRAVKDQVHLLDGRRVITVPLPPRYKAGDPRNYLRVQAVAEALYRRRVSR